ncbi:MAG TPA: DegV family protein [Solirubrobacterales bacterium]|nr:DegV family protein [Solirubrobacterales bacterium]
MSTGLPTAVVCDTTGYLPAELISELRVSQVSLYVSTDGEMVPETEISDYGEFYERLRASDAPATTSQPSIGDFVAAYEPLLEEGKEIVSVHLSAGISGTVEAAGQAKERLTAEGKGGERIRVCDTRSAAGGMGMIVLAAARAAREGLDGAAVLARAAEARENLKIWFAIDTLEYLKRGGRIGGAAAFVGSALQIKPILSFESEITPVERVRTRARSLERLRDYARQRHESGADGWVVQHIQTPDAAAALVADAREIFGREPLFVSEVGPVLGAHAGPGMIGIGSTTLKSLGMAD